MFTAAEIRDTVYPVRVTLADPNARILQCSIDSRQIGNGSEVCFIALRGLRNDGHQFLTKVWQAGVRNFVVYAQATVPELPDSNIFFVDDTVRALQLIASAHRSKFTLPCIGVTGSNGKTWVKEWLYQLLAPDHFIVKSPRSYNSQIGVPLSVLQIRSEHTLGIFEAGISLIGEMVRLSDIIQPEIGILTHMGDAHQAGFASMEEKLAEKLQLFKAAKTIAYCADEDWINDIVNKECKGKNILTWKTKKAEETEKTEKEEKTEESGVDLFVGIEKANEQTKVRYTFHGIEGMYAISFTDPASVQNSVTCALVLLHLGYSPEVISTRMQGLHAIALRLAIHHLPGNSVLINDSYSLDMGSLAVALETLKQHSADMLRTVIVSDIDHQHAGSYKGMADLFVQHNINHVLAIGKEIAHLGTLLPETVKFHLFADVAAFLHARPWQSLMPGAFLLKGARNFHFEQLAEHIQGRYHSAVLEIDLNTLLHNLQYFISRLQPKTKIIAMVKAAAYGSGGAEIARFLAFHNVAAFAVAYIDEGIDLRHGGIHTPILVMNPDPLQVDQLYIHDLEPEVYDFALLHAIELFSGTKPLRIHIKVDTGMHRLGFHLEEAQAIVDMLKKHINITVASVFTHLAAAGDLKERDFTLKQIAVFNAFYETLTQGIGYKPERHVLNTAGVLHFPEHQYEAVRLGIGLYGAGLNGIPAQLQAVHTLKARISQIHDIAAGDSVGYDRAYTAPKAMRIGTINIGYADGLRRCAGHEKYAVSIHGKPAIILGKVCMDMAMIDLSADPEAQPGDEVIIFGPDLPVDDLAKVCNTIPYEILTGISQRVARLLVYS